MIYTVTFNPAIDYVVRLDRELQVGDVNRARGEDCVLGGKGINVSGVLAQLGCESVALGFVAGETGAWLERGLAAQGLKTDFVHLDHGMTRINVKIKAGQETELNGAGDSMVAGFVAGYQQSGGDYEAALRLGTACGSATAFSLGLATKADIDALLATM